MERGFIGQPVPAFLRACCLQLETASAVIASKAKQSRLRVCGGGLVWIASLSLAMTREMVRLEHILLQDALW